MSDTWFNNMFYNKEAKRGLYAYEDHFIPGFFDVNIKKNTKKRITLYTELVKKPKDQDVFIKCPNGNEIIKKELKRQKELINKSEVPDGFSRKLVKAADMFIVNRKSVNSKTIIAGYHWFSDWGRDTMIAFSGLTLITKRFKVAKEILYTYSKYVKNGLIPNMFPDIGSKPIYNSVDAALWYFEAVYKYFVYTGDKEFIKVNIFNTLEKIIEAFNKGTDFNIYKDKDSLISAGDEKTQLTWMDAKSGKYIVTPRHGKAVEINALFYNALKIMDRFQDEFGYNKKNYYKEAKKCKQSFNEKFWNDEKKCLYDIIRDDYIDDSIRPNQVLAISLSFQVIDDKKRAKKIVDRIWNDLYTTFGLRTLNQDNKAYIGTYGGDQPRRDLAYHQGTVWVWIFGHFITAFLKVYDNKDAVKQMIEPFKEHLNDACIGNISEIFEGDKPHYPRGCIAQAWSISEILRIYIEHKLYE